MVEKIIWTKLAQKEFYAIITYFEHKASEQAIEKFYQLVEEKLELLEKYPESGRLVEIQRQVRVVNLDKYRQMVYRVKGKSLYISHFFDMRQNPNKRPY
jgi:plasmid stabilization system protein ParE